MAASQITLRELLKDPLYRQWFGKVPKLKFGGHERPWRVYAQDEPGGKWTRTYFPSYGKAYAFVRENLRESHDMALSCGPQGYRPPVVKVKGKRQYYVPDVVARVNLDAAVDVHKHIWCPFCRRWTLFLWYKKHHAMPKHWGTLSPDRRCKICGVRLEFVRSSRY